MRLSEKLGSDITAAVDFVRDFPLDAQGRAVAAMICDTLRITRDGFNALDYHSSLIDDDGRRAIDALDALLRLAGR